MGAGRGRVFTQALGLSIFGTEINEMAKYGTCSLCLSTGPLTFEHVPPKRVFNSKPAVAHTIFGLKLGSEHGKTPVLQRNNQGLGVPSLCEGCNGSTAKNYGEAFYDWTVQCLNYADKIRGNDNLQLSFTIEPLAVLKQIGVMLIAASSSTHHTADLDAFRHFLLSPRCMTMPSDLKIAAYLNPVDPKRRSNPLLTQNRLASTCAVLDIRNGASVVVLGEVSFPPAGYVGYWHNGREAISDDFVSLPRIDYFSNYNYGRRANLFLNMPARFPFGPVPGYYPNLNTPNGRQFVDDNHVVLG